MVIVGHMSSKSAFGAKNTGQKFLTPKNFWWCRNVCHDSCPGVIFGAGRGGAAPSFSGAGRGRVENFRGRGGPGQPFPPGPGPGGAGRASLAKWLPWSAPAPKIFYSASPRPGKRWRCQLPCPENCSGAGIGANVPTSSKVFGSQKLLTSIFSLTIESRP